MLARHKESASGNLLHKFPCKQGRRAARRWEEKKEHEPLICISPFWCLVSLQQGFNWSDGARSHTLDTGDTALAYECWNPIPASSQHARTKAPTHTLTTSTHKPKCYDARHARRSIFIHPASELQLFLTIPVETMNHMSTRKFINSNRHMHMHGYTYEHTSPTHAQSSMNF